jgi:cell division control protein 6
MLVYDVVLYVYSVMVLDEIDQLDSKNQEILYTIFEWPSLQKSRLILVGT